DDRAESDPEGGNADRQRIEDPLAAQLLPPGAGSALGFAAITVPGLGLPFIRRRGGRHVRIARCGFRRGAGGILGGRGIDGSVLSGGVLRDLRFDCRSEFGPDFLDLLFALVEAAAIEGDRQGSDDARDSGAYDRAGDTELTADDRRGRRGACTRKQLSGGAPAFRGLLLSLLVFDRLCRFGHGGRGGRRLSLLLCGPTIVADRIGRHHLGDDVFGGFGRRGRVRADDLFGDQR